MKNEQKIIPLNNYQYNELLSKYNSLKNTLDVILEKLETRK